jgi:hypothetical protein
MSASVRLDSLRVHRRVRAVLRLVFLERGMAMYAACWPPSFGTL